MEPSIFEKLIEWIWLPAFAMISHLYQKIFRLTHSQNRREIESTHTRGKLQAALAVLSTNVENQKEQLDRNEEEHRRLHEKIDHHHETMIGELRGLRNLIKNGH